MPIYEFQCPECGEMMTEKNQWVPIAERLPDFDTPVVITDGTSACTTIRLGSPSQWYWGSYGWTGACDPDFDFDEKEATHWMPLPKLPDVPPPSPAEVERKREELSRLCEERIKIFNAAAEVHKRLPIPRFPDKWMKSGG